MFFLRQPSSETIQRFISSQRDLTFLTQKLARPGWQLPSGYTVDRNRIRLGEGQETFERAVAALRLWKQSDLGWQE